VGLTTEIGVSWDEVDKSGSRNKPYIRVRRIAAGKFHRYRGLSLENYFAEGAKTLRDVTFGNIAGFFGFVAGFFQSFFRLVRKSERPDVVFLKGGFVGLPVGLVSRLLKIPYVIHESDSTPGLANRILMKHAKVVAMGMNYAEGGKNWEWVGIPVAPEFKAVSETAKKSLKKTLGFDPERPLVMVTGGSQGALHIDLAMREILPEMLKFSSVGLVAGRKHYEEMLDLKKYEEWDKAKLQSNFRLWNFSPAMHELLGAADVVISRAGATTIAELATLKKAVILVPYEKLPGGHQMKNAERLEKAGAVEVIADSKMEADPKKLLELTRKLVRSPRVREELAEKLHSEVRPGATERLAEILVNLSR